MIDLLLKALKGLNSDDNPWSIATAIALGMIVGLTPFWSIHNLVIGFIAFLFRTHLSSFWLSIAVFTMIGSPLAPLFNDVGNALLGNPEQQALWTSLYQSEFWRLTRFNHSNVLGGIIVALISFVPTLLLSYILVVRYRANLKAWLLKTKLVQWLRATKGITLLIRLQERG